MRVGLFIPCDLDTFEPDVGIATLDLLERLGCTVDYPFDQTCCGQPMVNTGCHKEAAATEALFVENFAGYEYIVCPSGSCTHQVRANLTAIEQTETVQRVRANVYELTEFLHDVLKVEALPWARFPHKIGIHYNCNSLGGIGLASSSELRRPHFSKPRDLLSRTSNSLSRRAPMSAAGSAVPSAFSNPPSRPRWGTTKSPIMRGRVRNTSSPPTHRAFFTRRGALTGLVFLSSSFTSPVFSMERRRDRQCTKAARNGVFRTACRFGTKLISRPFGRATLYAA